MTYDEVFAGPQASGGNVVPGTNRPVTFDNDGRITIPAGRFAYCDPIELNYVKNAAGLEAAGRKLAVSFHVVGSSGPMTWHAKAMTTSYLMAAGILWWPLVAILPLSVFIAWVGVAVLASSRGASRVLVVWQARRASAQIERFFKG